MNARPVGHRRAFECDICGKTTHQHLDVVEYVEIKLQNPTPYRLGEVCRGCLAKIMDYIGKLRLDYKSGKENTHE